MAASPVQDAGASDPEASGGLPLNGNVGRGLAETLLRLIAAQPGVRRICDLGCGNGYLAGQLGARGFDVLGIDASETYIDIARRHHTSERVTFIKGLIDQDLTRQLTASHPPFDLVVSSDVIEHLYDPVALLTTAHALLKPGGVAVIGTPYHGYLKNIAISVLGRWDEHHTVNWPGGHIKFFSVGTLSRIMRQAGLNEPRLVFYGRFPGFWKNMIAVARKGESGA